MTVEQSQKPPQENNVSIAQEDIEKLKAIHMKHTKILLSDAEALELGLQLMNLHRPIISPIPEGYSIENDDPKWQ